MRFRRFDIFSILGRFILTILAIFPALPATAGDDLVARIRETCEFNAHACDILSCRTSEPIGLLAGAHLIKAVKAANRSLAKLIGQQNASLRDLKRTVNQSTEEQLTAARAMEKLLLDARDQLNNLGLAETVNSYLLDAGRSSLEQKLEQIQQKIAAIEANAFPTEARTEWRNLLAEYRESRQQFEQAVATRQAMLAVLDDRVAVELPATSMRDLRLVAYSGMEELLQKTYAEANSTLAAHRQRIRSYADERKIAPSLKKSQLGLIRRLATVVAYQFRTAKFQDRTLTVNVTVAFLASGPVMVISSDSDVFNRDMRKHRLEMQDELADRIEQQSISDYSNQNDPMIADIKAVVSEAYAEAYPQSDKNILAEIASANYYLPMK